jgi:hypothetical protein
VKHSAVCTLALATVALAVTGSTALAQSCINDADCATDSVCIHAQCVVPEQEAVPPRQVNHGLLVQMLAGYGYSSVSDAQYAFTQTMESVSLRAGGHVGPPGLFVTLQAGFRSGNSANASTATETLTGSHGVGYSLGPGVEYYLPFNVFAGLTLAYVHDGYDGSWYHPRPPVGFRPVNDVWSGYGVVLDLGKEWQVTQGLLLGVGLQVQLASERDSVPPLDGSSASGWDKSVLLALSTSLNP